MRGRLLDLTIGLTGKQRVTIELDGDLRPDYEKLRETDVSVDLKKFRKKRSLDQNAYAWKLIGDLAAVLRVSPEDVYRNAIRDIGGNYEITPIRNDALESWKRIWQSHGIGWVCEEIGASKLDGYTNVRNFFGSSTYDSAQMSRLLDVIIRECKEQGVEHLTPMELARLEWNG